MKTPKREYKKDYLCPDARWHRTIHSELHQTMTNDQQAACFAGGVFGIVLTLIAFALFSKAQDDKEHAAILAAHAYTIKISMGRSYEIHYVKKGDYRIEDGILYFRKAGKTHIAKGEYIIHEN